MIATASAPAVTRSKLFRNDTIILPSGWIIGTTMGSYLVQNVL
jgi:hypothetical protein